MLVVEQVLKMKSGFISKTKAKVFYRLVQWGGVERKELSAIDNQGDYTWYTRNNYWETSMAIVLGFGRWPRLACPNNKLNL